MILMMAWKKSTLGYENIADGGLLRSHSVLIISNVRIHSLSTFQTLGDVFVNQDIK